MQICAQASDMEHLNFSEVLKALLKTRDLYERWRLGDEGIEIRSAEEQEWAATELRNSLRSIEWDLEDLDDTVQIVEKNPAKFRIDAGDLSARKSFIKQTKDEVEQMKQRSSVQNRGLGRSSKILEVNRFFTRLPESNYIGCPPLVLQTPTDATSSLASPSSESHLVPNVLRNNKYSRLATSGSPSHSKVSSTQELIQQQIRHQEGIVQQQDAQLSQMSSSVGTLRNMSSAISTELDEQAVMLDEFGGKILFFLLFVSIVLATCCCRFQPRLNRRRRSSTRPCGKWPRF